MLLSLTTNSTERDAMKAGGVSVKTFDYDMNIRGEKVRVQRKIELNSGESISFVIDVALAADDNPKLGEVHQRSLIRLREILNELLGEPPSH